MNLPLISVLIPVYNTQSYLPGCLDSVLAQTYENLEVIVVDDGSVDDSPRICDEYAKKDGRIKVYHQENSGIAVTRNRLLNLCGESKYITFVDSDDRLLPDSITEWYETAEQNDAYIVICNALFDNGFRTYASKNNIVRQTVYTPEEILKEHFTGGRIQTAPWGKLFRKELFASLRFPEVRTGEDYMLMHELYGASPKTVHCGKALYVQTVRPGSLTTSKFNENRLIFLDADRAVQKYVRERFPELYPYVGRNYADALRNAMADICRSHVRRRYLEEYRQMETDLKAEIQRLEQEDNYDLTTHRFAVEHPICFRMKHSLNGTAVFLKRNVKKLIKRG